MNYCQELVDRYTAFYLPKYRPGSGFSSRACIKPLMIAQNVVVMQTRSSNEELQDMISAELSKLMAQVHNGTAEGRWVLHGQAELDAIAEFSRFFMQEFWVAIGQDSARLVGNKFAIIQNTCEFLVKGMKWLPKIL